MVSALYMDLDTMDDYGIDGQRRLFTKIVSM